MDPSIDADIPQIVFFDTEFSSLGEISPVQLISVALCDLQGRELFYGEFDDFDPGLCSDFVMERVAPLLWRGPRAMEAPALGEGFSNAIAALGRPCVLACDSSWDWLFAQALAQGVCVAPSFPRQDPRPLPGWPANLLPRRMHLNFDALPEAPRLAAEIVESHVLARSVEHHALTDVQLHAAKARAAIEAAGLELAQPRAIFDLFGVDPAYFLHPYVR